MWTVMLSTVLSLAAGDNVSYTIRLITDEKTIEYQADGTKRGETIIKADPLNKQLSPDGKHTLYWKDGAIFVADAQGRGEQQISPAKQRSAAPVWSPDSQRIAFSVRRNDQWQLHTVDRDGQNLRQITDWSEGVEAVKYSPKEQLSYLRRKKWEGKFQPSDLVIFDGQDHTALVENTFISDYAWSPDGKRLAYGKLHALVIVDVASGKSEEKPLSAISEQFFHHAPNSLAWSPDGKSIACRIPAYVGRAATREGEPSRKIFGDDEVFVIPLEGKAHWFEVGDLSGRIEWAK